MSVAADDVAAPQRAAVRKLAALGAPAETIRHLHGHDASGALLDAGTFARVFARELGEGLALANVRVSEALLEHTVSGKHATLLLGWAKQHLGWSGEGGNHESDGDSTRDDSARALAALQLLLDQLAVRKAGSDQPSPELAGGGAAEPVAAGRGLA